MFLRRVFFDGKIVAFQYGYKSFFRLKKEIVGYYGTMLVASVGETGVVAAETVEVITLLYAINIACLVETFKQTAIEKWDI